MVNAGAILVLSLLLNLSEVDMSLAEKFDWVMNYFKVSPPPPFFFKNANECFPCALFSCCTSSLYSHRMRDDLVCMECLSMVVLCLCSWLLFFFIRFVRIVTLYTSTTNESNKGVTKPSTFLKLQYFAPLIYFCCLVSACISHSVFL